MLNSYDANVIDNDSSTSCTGSISNGECCPYGAFDNDTKKCCPYGNIVNDKCCITGSTKSYGNVLSNGGDRDCPKDSISVAFDSSNYSSLVASATKKVGATASATSTGSSSDATETTTTTTGSDSTKTSASGEASNSGSNPALTSTSTGLAARATAGIIPLAVVLGAGAVLI